MNEATVRLNEAKPLPDGWRWVRLGETLELHDSGLWGSHDPVNGISVIRSVNFRNDGRISTEDIAKIRPDTRNIEGKRLRKGDILLERSGGGPKQPVGRVVLFDLDREFYFGNFISRLRCKVGVDPNFIFLYLFSIHMAGITLSLQDQTTGIRNLRFAEYLQLPIPLPSLPEEQKRIVAKVQESMKEVEHARTACEEQLEAAKTLPQAYLCQVFESEEAKKWERRSLGEVLELHDSGLWGYENPKNGILIIRSVNFRNDGRISIDNIVRIEPNTQDTGKKKLRRGDILLERSGGGPKQPVGRVVLFDLDGEFYFGNFISRLRCKNEIESQFLFFYLFFIHMKGITLSFQDQTTGIRNLRFGEYLQLPIPIPNLDIQNCIGLSLKDKIASAEKLKASIEKQLEAIKALPQAILRKAFRGEL